MLGRDEEVGCKTVPPEGKKVSRVWIKKSLFYISTNITQYSFWSSQEMCNKAQYFHMFLVEILQMNLRKCQESPFFGPKCTYLVTLSSFIKLLILHLIFQSVTRYVHFGPKNVEFWLFLNWFLKNEPFLSGNAVRTLVKLNWSGWCLF